ncbi:hypothetical protein D6817_03105 [Candidatus Pacearchaeota archaeon]|nr:MAG: hypothetical protein D6817_03105 [Candidatus Pacearchaeota archaeon]
MGKAKVERRGQRREQKVRGSSGELNLSDARIRQLLNFEHVEELFHIITLMNEKQTERFLEHYKQTPSLSARDRSLDRAIRTSRNHAELERNVLRAVVEHLNSEREALASQMSELRKQGIDTYIEELKLMKLKHKISLFHATGKKEDYYKAKKLIFEIGEELRAKLEGEGKAKQNRKI